MSFKEYYVNNISLFLMQLVNQFLLYFINSPNFSFFLSVFNFESFSVERRRANFYECINFFEGRFVQLDFPVIFGFALFYQLSQLILLLWSACQHRITHETGFDDGIEVYWNHQCSICLVREGKTWLISSELCFFKCLSLYFSSSFIVILHNYNFANI